MDTSENLWIPRDLTPEQMCFNQPIKIELKTNSNRNRDNNL